MRKINNFPITWAHMKLNGRECWGGFCGKTNMLFAFTLGILEPLMVHDLIIEDGCCEEAEGCLYQDCPLNRTTPASYWKRHGLEGPPPHKMKGAFAHGVELPVEFRHKEGGVVMGVDNGPVLELQSESGS